jgi:general L-amino acid transport system substrate-binding protein
MMSSDNPEVRRLLGVEGSFGQAELGLEVDAIARAVRTVGNYGEIYERNLGSGGIGIPRGLNRLWTDGGLIYAPPLR